MDRNRGFDSSVLQLVVFSVLFILQACVSIPVLQEPELAESFQSQNTRQLETKSFKVLYPEKSRDAVLRMISAGETCAQELRKFADFEQVSVHVVEYPFENAFVKPMPYNRITIAAGGLLQIADEAAISPGSILCHELVHYVMLSQRSALSEWTKRFFGEVLPSPVVWLDPWVHEGVATYYESKFDPVHGRLNSPFYRSLFSARYADRAFTPSDLHVFRRDAAKPSYVNGSHFIEFLAQTYGEEKIWEWIKLQGRSPWLLFGVGSGSRFEEAFGISLNDAVEKFDKKLRLNLNVSLKPAGQKTLVSNAGHYRVILTSHPNGRMAWMTDGGLDEVDSLFIRESDGKILHRIEVPDVLPPRSVLQVRALKMFFSTDASQLYISANTHTKRKQPSFDLYAVDISSGKVSDISADTRTIFHSIHPDGKVVYGVRWNNDTPELVSMPVDGPQAGKIQIMRTLPAGNKISDMSLSPDGKELAAVIANSRGTEVWIFPIQHAGQLANTASVALNQGRRVSYVSWVDSERILYSASHEGKGQIFLFDRKKGVNRLLTNAPYLSLSPYLNQGNVVFVDYTGQSISIDAVELNPVQQIRALSENSEKRPEVHDIQEAMHLPTQKSDSTEISSEQGYSRWQGFFIPRSRLPSFTSGSDKSVGLDIAGHDDLILHSWAAGLKYRWQSRKADWSLEYSNAFLAPVMVSAKAEDKWNRLRSAGNTETWELLRSSSILATRPVEDSMFGLGLTHSDRQSKSDPNSDLRLTGPQLNLEWGSERSTAFAAGPAAGLDFTLAASHYSKALYSSYSMTDARGELNLAWRPPLLTRHSLMLKGTVRNIWDSPSEKGIVRIGGFGKKTALLKSTGEASSPENPKTKILSNLDEYALGFEDAALLSNRFALSRLIYANAFPVDHAWLSNGFLPTAILRDFNFALFSSHVLRWQERQETAAGGLLSAHLVISNFPLEVAYQASRRLTGDQKFMQMLYLETAFLL